MAHVDDASKRQRVFIVDAFAAGPFSGNPAAVCVYERRDKFHDAQLLRIAAEMNLSETCFCWPHENGEPGSYQLRWFTPTVEVPLCGHGTLATAHVLFNELACAAPEVRFATLKGELRVRRDAVLGLVMDFPLGAPMRVPTASPALLEKIAAALHLRDAAAIQDVWQCNSTRKLTLVVNSAALLPALQPDDAALLSLAFPAEWDVRGIIVTAAGDAGGPYDFLSRYFAPWNSISEDPVTGSAHTVLAVVWAARLGGGRTSFSAFQASKRGGAMGVRIGENGRVFLSGTALTMMDGTLRNIV